MTAVGDWQSDVDAVVRTTDALLATARAFDDADLPAPSACEGWTRGHVLSHLARNADALAGMLEGAARGEQVSMYASPQQRDADIEAGAGRSARELEIDLEASSERLLGACAALPAGQRAAEVTLRGGRVLPAGRLPWLRVREVVLHHLDLRAGFGVDDLEQELAARLLHQTVRTFGERDDVPPVVLHVTDTGGTHAIGHGGPRVTGSTRHLVGWLTGRTGGEGLDGDLPSLPGWG